MALTSAVIAAQCTAERRAFQQSFGLAEHIIAAFRPTIWATLFATINPAFIGEVVSAIRNVSTFFWTIISSNQPAQQPAQQSAFKPIEWPALDDIVCSTSCLLLSLLP